MAKPSTPDKNADSNSADDGNQKVLRYENLQPKREDPPKTESKKNRRHSSNCRKAEVAMDGTPDAGVICVGD